MTKKKKVILNSFLFLKHSNFYAVPQSLEVLKNIKLSGAPRYGLRLFKAPHSHRKPLVLSGK